MLALTLLSALAVALLAALVVLTVRRAPRRLGLRRRVLVNLHAGKAVEGVLWDRRGDYLVLKDVTLHVENAASTTVQGEVLVHQAQVEFVQIAGG